MDPETTSNKKVIAAIAVLIVVAIIVLSAKAFGSKKPMDASNTALTATAPAPTTTTSSSSSANNPTSSTTQTYKDGTYSATGSYESPAGEENITITVALQNGTITNTSAKSGANDGNAEAFQADFISTYKPLVIGRSISTVTLNRVSGSSLTSQGFNSAIQKIKQQAQA